MEHNVVVDVQVRALRTRLWVGISTASMILSVAMLVFGWVISMTLLVTSSRLLEFVFALP